MSRGVRTLAQLAISVASIKVMHYATPPESAWVTTWPRQMEHFPTNLIKTEIAKKIIVIKLIAVIIS